MSETMSFREKTAWACLVTTLVVWIPYFVRIFQLFEHSELTASRVLGAFIAAAGLQVVLQIVAAIVISVRSKQEPKDERDQTIDAKSSKNAYFVLGFSCLFAVGWIIVYAVTAGQEAAAQLLTPTAISQMVLFCFVAAETTRFATQVVSYRRGS